MLSGIEPVEESVSVDACPPLAGSVDTAPDPSRSVTRALDLHAPVVKAERILRIQGYADLDRVRPVIRRAAQAMADRAEQLSRPVAAFRHVSITRAHGDVLELSAGAALRCEAFGSRLSGCSGIVPFVLTLGNALPQEVVELIERGDLLEGLLLETAGWLAIEDATRQFKVWLREACVAQEQRITSRMGPGYTYRIGNRTCEWPLQQQAELFALFGGADLPVKLMPSCAMSPKMSRSGLYGLAPISVGARPLREPTVPLTA